MDRTASAIKVLDEQGAYCGQCSREPGDPLGNCRDCAAVLKRYAQALEEARLLMPDVQVIRTPEELEALAQKDPNAVVLAGEAGVARTVKALCELRQLVYAWGLPAVVIATGDQVRDAREEMEKDNE